MHGNVGFTYICIRTALFCYVTLPHCLIVCSIAFVISLNKSSLETHTKCRILNFTVCIRYTD